ncbi:hypothetical protein [Halobacteriovorax sp. JY17]|uniref:hypothetical protein n=1 Tax=Halobacteriovorax sp. JY17 TaxID=2014617 RepID=UPI000C38A633|nr:hypothetical protein [Halobacteriovorax sp. JY17]PIK16042.1 MAG: hypothetical protein CES88_04745 [Halobacteriovorax sp. JY17]
MLKDFIKIQILAILILVINALATQDFKVVTKKEESAPREKVLKKKAKKNSTPQVITSTDPKKMLLDALRDSLN